MTSSKRCLAVVALTAVLAVFALALSGQGRQEEAGEPSKKGGGLLGDPTVTGLRGATRVEAFRIRSERTNDDVPRIAGYPIVATAKEQGKDYAGRLTNVLFTDATYEGRANRCFEPGVAFRVWTDKKEA